MCLVAVLPGCRERGRNVIDTENRGELEVGWQRVDEDVYAEVLD